MSVNPDADHAVKAALSHSLQTIQNDFAKLRARVTAMCDQLEADRSYKAQGVSRATREGFEKLDELL